MSTRNLRSLALSRGGNNKRKYNTNPRYNPRIKRRRVQEKSNNAYKNNNNRNQHYNGNYNQESTKDAVTMFENIGIECKSSTRNIINKCDYLQRLIHALKLYDNNDKTQLISLCTTKYGIQLLDDIKHVLSNHSNQYNQIKTEMIEIYNLTNCDIEQCLHSLRHFNRKRHDDINGNDNEYDEKISLYLQELDSLHFNLMHLYQTGYRYHVDNFRMIHDGSDNKVDIDAELVKMSKVIRGQRDKYLNKFDRFNSEKKGNVSKYKLTPFAGVYQHSIDELPPFMDRMIKFIQEEEDYNIDKKEIQRLEQYLISQEYDSDSIKDDMINDQDNISSNICRIFDKKITNSMNKYIKNEEYGSFALNSTFSTGLIFFYWDYFNPTHGNKIIQCKNNTNDYSGFTTSDLYISKGKYQNIKQELIGRVPYKKILNKAQEYIETEGIKSIKADIDVKYVNNHFGIKGDRKEYGRIIEENGDKISLNHLISIITYCDTDTFSSKWSESFRFKYYGESLNSIKKRNSKYYHLSKALRELVQCFGNCGMRKRKFGYSENPNQEQHGPFYCGISKIMAFPSICIRLCGPCSTSKERAIAVKFAGEEGLVVEFKNHIQELHFFDCWMSHFKAEREILQFGGGHMIKIEEITHIKSGRKYSKLMQRLVTFEQIINGSHENNFYNDELLITSSNVNRLKDFIVNNLENNNNDEYEHQLLNTFRFNKNEITINFHHLSEARKNKENIMDNLIDIIMYKLIKTHRFNSIFDETEICLYDIGGNNFTKVVKKQGFAKFAIKRIMDIMDCTENEAMYAYIVVDKDEERAINYMLNNTKKDNGNDMNEGYVNQLKYSFLFKLFPSMQKLTIYTTDKPGVSIYKFDLCLFVQCLFCDNNNKYCAKHIEIKANRKGTGNDPSWIYNDYHRNKVLLFEKFNELSQQKNKYRLTLKKEIDGPFVTDILCIHAM